MTPSRFAAAASIEGYYNPEPDGTTGTLASALQQDPQLAQRCLTDLAHRAPAAADLHLLVMTSHEGPAVPAAVPGSSSPDEKNVPGVQPYVLQDLGHTLDTFAAVLPPILGWLADVAGA